MMTVRSGGIALLRTAAVVLSLTLVGHGQAADPVAAPKVVGNVFERPAVARLEQEITALIQARRYAAALSWLDRVIPQYPGYPRFHLAKAVLEMRAGQREPAIENFLLAWVYGDRQLKGLVAEAPFDSLPEDPRIAALLNDPADIPQTDPQITELPPVPVRQGRAMASTQNTYWDAGQQRLVSRFLFPDVLRTKPVMSGSSPVATRLRRLVAEGRAAGLVGDLYDNRDRGHARLAPKAFPQLTHIEYVEEARAAGIEYGVNSQFLFDAITVGNSSTAIKGNKTWRSQPRLALTSSLGAASLAQSYANNQIYLFPEHRDHDVLADKGKGDLFHANTPYVLISQGSSSSEKKLIEAVAIILAGLPPATKDKLRTAALIAPAVQQIFRRGRKGIVTDEDYLSGKAHPTVFDENSLDPVRLLDLAQAMQADSVPPAVQLKVTAETQGRDPFADGLSEWVFDTPGAIARIHRSLENTRQMTVSAEATTDPNGRDLSFRWVVLRGDPGRVRISPLVPGGPVATIETDWHDRRMTASEPAIETDRVDIGVFAHNGVNWSAPSFISVHFPADQLRLYDAESRLLSVDFASKSVRKRYIDPLLFPRRNWRDEVRYAPSGQLIGWDRIRSKKDRARFTAHGLRVVETDGEGRPFIAEIVAYPTVNEAGKPPRIKETATGKMARYSYRNSEDLVGEPVLITPGE